MKSTGLALLLLAGCNDQPTERAVQPTECSIPPVDAVRDTDYARATATQWGRYGDTCVEHWARTLASSPDAPQAVVDATIGACELPMTGEADAYARNPKIIVQNLESLYRSKALFQVEQFRALACKK